MRSNCLPVPMAGTARTAQAHTGRSPASTDPDAVRAWLDRFVDTKTTFDNYRKEAERLLLWSVLQLGKPLSSLTHEDLLVYQHFLADPQPAARWTADGGRKHPRSDPRWRPFYGPLSASSQRQAMVILNVMFAWLVQAGYLAGNPLSLSRQRARRGKPRIVRYLSPELWLDVKTFIQGMPTQTAREREHRARALAFYPAVSRRPAHHGGRHEYDGPVFPSGRRKRPGPLVARSAGQR
jgi:hypothetical protein